MGKPKIKQDEKQHSCNVFVQQILQGSHLNLKSLIGQTVSAPCWIPPLQTKCQTPEMPHLLEHLPHDSVSHCHCERPQAWNDHLWGQSVAIRLGDAPSDRYTDISQAPLDLDFKDQWPLLHLIVLCPKQNGGTLFFCHSSASGNCRVKKKKEKKRKIVFQWQTAAKV